jgi:conjugal transfer/entry exclusion protein
MRDPSTEAASKTLKLARAAMGQVSGVKRKRGKMDDPLRTFSASVSYLTSIIFSFEYATDLSM